MQVDVTTQIEIGRPVALVAEFSAHPDNVPRWYKNIRSVRWQTEPVVRVGAKAAFVAHFMGRRMAYTYEIVEFEPGARLRMQADDGPFPMETTYTWCALDQSRTLMTLRNRGEPGGLQGLLAPLMAAMMRRANRQDLQLLKRVLEESLRC